MTDDDTTTAPVVPCSFVSGVRVVDIGDLRVARGLTRRPVRTCRHLGMVYDTQERRIYCEDCKNDVEAFDAFSMLVELHHHIEEVHKRMREAEQHTLISRAAKRIDAAFRCRGMAPQCPHCRAAILPEDIVNGLGMVNKEMELRRRGKNRIDHAR